jgi:hypothetical protein
MQHRPSVDRMLLRYLDAFGPASVMDAQNWCGLTRLGEVADRLRPDLVTFRDESGRELFDRPDAPRPDPDVEAPVRFLPQYDNLLLGHADRTRVVPAGSDYRTFFESRSTYGSVLVDGVVGCVWLVDKGVLTITPLVPLSRKDRAAVAEEGAALLTLLSPDVTPDVVFATT